METDTHGTPCAGIILADRDNAVCGVGVAYDSLGASIRIFGEGGITLADMAEAYTFGYAKKKERERKRMKGRGRGIKEGRKEGERRAFTYFDTIE